MMMMRASERLAGSCWTGGDRDWIEGDGGGSEGDGDVSRRREQDGASGRWWVVVVVGVKGAFVGVALPVSHEPSQVQSSARVGRAGGTGSNQRLALAGEAACQLSLEKRSQPG